MVIPHFSEGEPFRFVSSSVLTSGTSEGISPRIELALAQTFTISNLMNAINLLLPLGFLVLLGPFEAMMGVLPFVELLVYTGPPFGLVGSIYSWHITTVVPFVFFAAIAGTDNLIRRLSQ
ncbi:MAG TPA: hypothetical protein DIT99_22580, partial [Candidatus Latescibacteria bacterium]|nr:hypothetical protein [Candidatus Latescibacterota bacterium]